MDVPRDSAGSLLQAATDAQRRARSDRAWVWLPMLTFAGLAMLSSLTYIDWAYFGNYKGGVEYSFNRWSWGVGISVWPMLYWLVAAPLGAWITHRQLRRREADRGVRLGTVVPLLVIGLVALVLTRLLANWGPTAVELLVAPVGLLALAIQLREWRAVGCLVVTTALTIWFVRFNYGQRPNQWLIPAEVTIVALSLVAGAYVARPRRQPEDARAPRP